MTGIKMIKSGFRISEINLRNVFFRQIVTNNQSKKNFRNSDHRLNSNNILPLNDGFDIGINCQSQDTMTSI